uniref:Secreted protein n=1 Tax=Rhizophora mucronata TaxID=61149 RepID=A0A2P2P602_RHIMU
MHILVHLFVGYSCLFYLYFPCGESHCSICMVMSFGSCRPTRLKNFKPWFLEDTMWDFWNGLNKCFFQLGLENFEKHAQR